MVITSTPNIEGLTESCAAAAEKGIEKGNSEAIMVRLNDLIFLSVRHVMKVGESVLKVHVN